MHAMILPDEAIQMINIKPSAAIRRDYNSISELCKRSGEPGRCRGRQISREERLFCR